MLNLKHDLQLYMNKVTEVKIAFKYIFLITKNLLSDRLLITLIFVLLSSPRQSLLHD